MFSRSKETLPEGLRYELLKLASRTEDIHVSKLIMKHVIKNSNNMPPGWIVPYTTYLIKSNYDKLYIRGLQELSKNGIVIDESNFALLVQILQWNTSYMEDMLKACETPRFHSPSMVNIAMAVVRALPQSLVESSRAKVRLFMNVSFRKL